MSRTVVVPLQISSQNVYTWSHWSRYAKDAKTWRRTLHHVLGPRVPKRGEPARVTITSHRLRLLDHGNLVGGAKPVPDALVRLGWLRDDSPAWCTIEYRQAVVGSRRECRTVIELHDELGER